MGLSSEAGRLLAQQFEQHQIRKRYHAIVRGWLMEEALLDYPLVEELDRIADKFAREDKGPQPAVTHYRGLATVEMPVATGAIPPRAMGWWNWSRKTGRKHQLAPSSGPPPSSDPRRQQARRFCGKTAAPRNISAVTA
ncbi:tRNA pseudouridine synthase C [Klebsiella pneumoniae]|uniref:tRNA pseudouridine synthase C n=1 Tax=Klebsiella pneumoniae TaxID=573 RepID=A0A3S4GXT3_KLEPN|nr:tRNA pseudouridine synthase C [Klebsiella pneumoniae]